MTHRQWLAEVTRLRQSRTPISGYARLAARVQRAARHRVTDWHLMQTWHLLSLAEAEAGNPRAAAITLRTLANHHASLLVEHRRALVSGAAAAAVHLLDAGDVASARAMLRRAEDAGRGLKPQEYLLRDARRRMRAAIRRQSKPARS